ncbi:alpha/beta fold hydrolase [Rhodococcus sp. PvR099]|uniref:thioesterase II family protein n=1 Tax=Rhodococcus sp. PvR099 TaxID=2806602 RepID=UPI0027DD6E61|nr:alpha/beta fold hydrolase [Rhodococcus sp. PvR099]
MNTPGVFPTSSGKSHALCLLKGKPNLTISANPSHWFRTFGTTPDPAARLVCFPHAGGSATYFRPLWSALPASIQLESVQYPGRQDRRNEPFADTVTGLAGLITNAFEWRDDVPTAFFGHSMGATVAFEVARRLEQRGRNLLVLFASGRRAPTFSPSDPVRLDTDADVLAELRRLGGTDAALLDDDDVMQMILPAVRNDYQAAEAYRYQPGPSVSCPIVALHGSDDCRVSSVEADGWRNHTSDTSFRYELNGGHFYLDTEYSAVARLVEQHLGVTPEGHTRQSDVHA